MATSFASSEAIKTVHGSISSFLEVPNIAAGRVSIHFDDKSRTLSTVSFSGYLCYVVSHDSSWRDGDLWACPRRLTIEFDRKVENACFDGEGNSILVLTRDGRLWYARLENLSNANEPRRLHQQDEAVQEILRGQNMVGATILSHCESFSNSYHLWIVAGSTLSPPTLITIRHEESNNSHTFCEAQDVPGLEYVRVPITTVLFVDQKQAGTKLLKDLLGNVVAGSPRGVIILGFADGSIRTSIVDNRGRIGHAQLMGYVNRCNARIVAILCSPSRTLLALNSHGAVEIVGRRMPFRRIVPGLPSGRVWTSAALIGSTDNCDARETLLGESRYGLVATSSDGSTHALILMDHNLAGEIPSTSFQLAMRKDIASIATVSDESRTWMAVATHGGSLVPMQLESLHCGGEAVGPLQSVGRSCASTLSVPSQARVQTLLKELQHAEPIRSRKDTENSLETAMKETSDLTQVALNALQQSSGTTLDINAEQNCNHCVVTTAMSSLPRESFIPSLHIAMFPKTMSLADLATESHVDKTSMIYSGTAVTTSTSTTTSKDLKSEIQSVASLDQFSLGTPYVSLSALGTSSSVAVSIGKIGECVGRPRLFGPADEYRYTENVVIPLPAPVKRHGLQERESKPSH